jgi:HSP20 family protein
MSMELDKFGTVGDLQELLAIRDRIDDLVERRLPEGVDALTPRAELRDVGDAFRLILEVPGVHQEDLEIAVQGRELVVAGHREADGDGATVVFSERGRGPFQRTVTLPGEVDAETASAQLGGGLLVLHLPKA